jgi:glycosyltransferase involved in cell wall biosynthesis
MISVIIPVFQSSRTIVQCLDSVFGQRDVEFEVLVVDDGSTDDIQSLLLPYRSRIGLYLREHQGACSARNFGAKQAAGEYLYFCDSDIVLEPDALAKFKKALVDHPEAAYAYCPFRFDSRFMRGIPFSATWLKRMNYISTMSLVRTKDFLGFDESLGRFQDWDMWLSMLEVGKRGILVPDPLFRTLPRKGISSSGANRVEAENIVRMKHHLQVPSNLDRVLWKLQLGLQGIFGGHT